MSKAMLGIALIELNRRAIAHDEVADFLQLVQAPAARPFFPFRWITGMKIEVIWLLRAAPFSTLSLHFSGTTLATPQNLHQLPR
jgi:hypothetical protein